MHRRRARRSGRRGLRDPRGDHRNLAGQEPRRRRPRHPRGHLALADGPRRLACCEAHPDRQGPQGLLDALARAAAQRPLCQARQGRELPQPRRLSSCSSSTSGSACSRASRRSSTSASRRAAGARSCGAQVPQARGGRHRPAADRPDRRGHHPARWISWTRTRRRGLREALGGPADLVLSDMAANTVGHQQTDHLRTMGLVEAGARVRRRGAAPGRRLSSPRCSRAAPTTIWSPR